jgi:dolichol-phosphate mannosyltransferase
MAALISLVIPVYNEAGSLEPLVEEVSVALPPTGHPFEVVLVDDGSTDGSFAVMEKLAGAYPNVRAIKLRRNFGKAAALMAGFREARGDAIVTIDGDLQDDPAEIPRLLAALEGADLVSGWKADRRDPWSRRAASRLFNAATGRASGVRLHDLNCGLKAYRAEVVRTLPLTGDLYRFIPVLAAQEGFHVSELPVNHRPRVHGRSKYGIERYLRGFLDLLTVVMLTRFAYRPGHLFGGLGAIFLLGGGAVLAYLTGLKLFTGASIGGRPLLLFGVLVVIVGLQLVLFGLLAELIISRTQRPVETRKLVWQHLGRGRA